MDTRSLKAGPLFYFVWETFNFSKRFYLNGLTAVPKEADNADIMSSFYSPGNSTPLPDGGSVVRWRLEISGNQDRPHHAWGRSVENCLYKISEVAPAC